MSGLVDLSQPIFDGMPYPQYFPRPRVDRVLELSPKTPQVTRIDLCVHMGTHVDAPSHFIDGGADIDEVPIDRFHFHSVVWPVSVGALGLIRVEDLKGVENRVAPGDGLFLHTGWGRLWRSPRYLDHPYLHDEVAELLLQLRVSILGVDFMTPDMPVKVRPPGFAFPIHRRLLGADVLIIENLGDQSALAGKRLEVFAFPLKIQHSDGSPLRVVARQVP